MLASEWTNSAGDVLNLSLEPLPDDLALAFQDIDQFIGRYREQTSLQSGAVVSVDVVERNGLEAMRTIAKFSPDPPRQMVAGSLFIPLANCGCVIHVVCQEQGITGVRETLVNVLTFASVIPIASTDDEQYDRFCPDLPLSLVRTTLRQIEETIRFQEDQSSWRLAQSGLTVAQDYLFKQARDGSVVGKVPLERILNSEICSANLLVNVPVAIFLGVTTILVSRQIESSWPWWLIVVLGWGGTIVAVVAMFSQRVRIKTIQGIVHWPLLDFGTKRRLFFKSLKSSIESAKTRRTQFDENRSITNR